jgi:hypothetical protein
VALAHLEHALNPREPRATGWWDWATWSLLRPGSVVGGVKQWSVLIAWRSGLCVGLTGQRRQWARVRARCWAQRQRAGAWALPIA